MPRPVGRGKLASLQPSFEHPSVLAGGDCSPSVVLRESVALAMVSVVRLIVAPGTVTETSAAVQVPSPGLLAEQRSVLPMTDRAAMPEVSAGDQGNVLSCGDLAVYDRNLAHAHADVWQLPIRANQLVD